MKVSGYNNCIEPSLSVVILLYTHALVKVIATLTLITPFTCMYLSCLCFRTWTNTKSRKIYTGAPHVQHIVSQPIQFHSAFQGPHFRGLCTVCIVHFKLTRDKNNRHIYAITRTNIHISTALLLRVLCVHILILNATLTLLFLLSLSL